MRSDMSDESDKSDRAYYTMNMASPKLRNR
jgi:hypothetical protein